MNEAMNWLAQLDWGSIADWIAAVAAVAAVVVARCALRHSQKIDELNSKLLKRQTSAEHVYWHVHADLEAGTFVFSNIGTSTAKNVTAHVFIEGTKHLENASLGDCPGGATRTMPSTDFLADQGTVAQFYQAQAWVRASHNAGNSKIMTMQVLIDWKDSLGFKSHQEIPITFG